jgi:hypothetical protein
VKPETRASRLLGAPYQGGEIGITTTPSRESLSAFSSAIEESGVSRTHSTIRMRSLSATCAARVISVSPMPAAILASVETLHGTTTRAS